MNYTNFAARLRTKHSGRTVTSNEEMDKMLKTAEDLHLKHGVPLKHIADELVKEPTWSAHTAAAILVRLSRHMRQKRGLKPAKGSRRPRKKERQ